MQILLVCPDPHKVMGTKRNKKEQKGCPKYRGFVIQQVDIERYVPLYIHGSTSQYNESELVS